MGPARRSGRRPGPLGARTAWWSCRSRYPGPGRPMHARARPSMLRPRGGPASASARRLPRAGTRPEAWARAAASVRVVASSLVRIRETWTLAVFGEMNRRGRDRPVRGSAGDQAEHLALALGQGGVDAAGAGTELGVEPAARSAPRVRTSVDAEQARGSDAALAANCSSTQPWPSSLTAIQPPASRPSTAERSGAWRAPAAASTGVPGRRLDRAGDQRQEAGDRTRVGGGVAVLFMLRESGLEAVAESSGSPP